MKFYIPLLWMTALLWSCTTNESTESVQHQKSYNLSSYGYDLTMHVDSIKYPQVNFEESYMLNVSLNKDLAFQISFEDYNQAFELSNPGLEIYQIKILEQNDSVLSYQKTLQNQKEYAFYIKKGGYILRNNENAPLNQEAFNEVLGVMNDLKIK